MSAGEEEQNSELADGVGCERLSADDVTRTWLGQTLALCRRAASLATAVTALAPARHFVLSLASLSSGTFYLVSVDDAILPGPPRDEDHSVLSRQDHGEP